MTWEKVGGSWRDPDDPGEPSTGQPRLSITEEEAAILAELARDQVVLEIGTGLGVSTRAMASTAEAVWTMDVDPWVHDNIWPELAKLAVIGIHGGAELEGCRFTMVFIDGDHSTHAVQQDLALARKVVTSDGSIVFHDVNYDSVRSGIGQELDVVFDTEHGIGVLWMS